MRELAGLFAIEVCGYSVMSNHLHLVLRNRPDIAEQRSDDEIALRWRRVFPPCDDTTGEPVEDNVHDVVIEALSGRLARPTSGPGVVPTGRIVQLLASIDHAHATIVSMSSVSDRRAASRADLLVICSER
jgi:hypothetical protein